MAPLRNSINNFKKQLLSPNNNAIIHNKFVLYFVLIISLLDLFYLSVERDMITIFIFILVGLLTSFFSKNMLVIMVIALTISSIIKHGTSISREGFEEEAKNEEMKNENMADLKDEDGTSVYTEGKPKKESITMPNFPEKIMQKIKNP